jgi:hypothetical protein
MASGPTGLISTLTNMDADVAKNGAMWKADRIGETRSPRQVCGRRVWRPHDEEFSISSSQDLRDRGRPDGTGSSRYAWPARDCLSTDEQRAGWLGA